MIDVSDAAPSRAASQPELAVGELSQICEKLVRQRLENMPAPLNMPVLIAPLLNAIPSVVFFIKNCQAYYLLANLTLVRRCGFKSVSSLLGKTSADVFPPTLSRDYTEQNLRVLRENVTLRDQLGMHLYNSRERGWYLTQELALRDVRGQMIGMAGISHDLQEARTRHPAWQRLAVVDDHIRRHYYRLITMEESTALSGMSITRIKRYCKRIFRLTPQRAIHKVRLEEAAELLADDTPVTDIALQCGYTDHSAFSRQLKAMIGSTPCDFHLAPLE